MRVHSLDDALLLFDPRTGNSVHVRGAATAGYRRVVPRVVQFAITNRCNLACGFCHRELGASSDWTVEEVFSLLRDLDRAGVLEVAFGGGEPFAFKGFPRLLRLLRETRLAVSVTTNGLLVDDALLAEIAGCYAELRVSLYDDIGVVDRFRGVRFGVNWLVTPERLPHLEQVVLELSARGAKSVLLLSYNGDDELHLSAEESADLGRRVGVLARALRGRTSIGTSVCFGDRLSLEHVVPMHGCDAGRDFVAITSDRCLKACSFHREKTPVRNAADVIAAFERRERMARAAPVRGCARSLPVAARAVDTDRTEIRVYSAFASNNSGTYALVGTMPSEAAAKELAEIVQKVCTEQSEWNDARDRAPGGPLEHFAAQVGLTLDEDDLGYDAWPEGREPSVLAIGREVLVYVHHTITMPRLFGELIYQRGGRVAVEYDHAHDAIVAVLSFWFGSAQKSEREATFGALEAALREVLPAKHVWPSDEWTVAVVFDDLPRGVARVQEVAARHGASVHLRLVESAQNTADPLLPWRSTARGHGPFQVVLWRVGDDRIAAMKAIRDATNLGLEAVKEKIDQLPSVILDEVDEPTARHARTLLEAANCSADIHMPTR